MQQKIILDSSYIISSAIGDDDNHKIAEHLTTHIHTFDEVYITNYIFAEISTVLSQRLGKSNSSIILQGFLENPHEIIWVDKDTDKKTQREFLKLKDKNISYVDLSTAIIAKQNKINAVATFDKHFKKLGEKYGFEVIGC